jgi:hypothetical protein
MREHIRETRSRQEVLVACQYCGSDVSDDADTCPICGMSTAIQGTAGATDTTHFEPGPSFVDLPEQDLDVAGIPGWLHSFGEAVATASAGGHAHATVVAEAPSAERSDPALPAWLEEPRPMPGGAPAPASLLNDVLSAEDSSSFISEDDLPEWLRSIGGESLATEGLLTGSPVTSDNGVLSVPAVSLAWIASHQMVALASGETLFARIAGEELPAVSANHSETAHHTDVPISHPQVEIATVTSAPASKSGNMRVLLLAALVMVAILLVLIVFVQR